MGRIVLIFFMTLALFFFGFLLARAEKIELQWDYEGDNPDGFRIYQKEQGNDFDYGTPVLEVPGSSRSAIMDLDGRDDEAVRYDFVARAVVDDVTSEDSNQVSYTVVRIPPPKPIDLKGQFDRQNGLIKIQWQQPADDYTVNHWRVYFKKSDEGPENFTELGLIEKDNPLELTTEFNVVPQGAREDIDFVVVSYRRSGAWSGNSEILTVDVDRREVGPVENLRINIEIPVI